MKTFKSPDCITESKRHSLVSGQGLFYVECEHCFERFVLISETVAAEIGLEITPKDIPGGSVENKADEPEDPQEW